MIFVKLLMVIGGLLCLALATLSFLEDMFGNSIGSAFGYPSSSDRDFQIVMTGIGSALLIGQLFI